MAFALSSFLQAMLGNDAQAAADAAQAQRLSEEDGEGAQWRLLADVISPLAAVPMNVVALEDALTACAKSHYRLAASGFRILAASRMLTRGDIRGAQAMMDPCDPAPEPCWAAELLRVHAELLARTNNGDRKGAEAMLRESLRLARDQKARLWENRTSSAITNLLDAH
jgi:hypothetical protein